MRCASGKQSSRSPRAEHALREWEAIEPLAARCGEIDAARHAPKWQATVPE
jgi:hypothetical protein